MVYWEGIQIIKHKDNLYKIECDMEKNTISDVLSLFKPENIQDISISSTPLEEIIKDIYRGKDE